MGTYSDLANLMADFPDMMILRRFSRLDAKNLLYYEAELACLEHELEAIELEDRHSGAKPRRDYATRWATMAASADAGNEPASTDGGPGLSRRDKLQWETFLKIRELLCKYNEALLQQAQLNSIAKPSPKSLDTLRDWLDRPGYGNMFLLGDTEGVWDKEKAYNDFVTFQHAADGLTEGLSGLLVRYKRHLTSAKQPKYHVYSLEESSRASVANGVITVISSVFPILPIVILFFIQRLIIRLGLILVFTVVFAAVLVFGMHMNPDRVLAITTAFAAIQVVFVGSTSKPTTS